MATFCPCTDLGFFDCQYYYSGTICETGASSEASDSRSHQLGSCDPQCPDPITVGNGGGSSPVGQPAVYVPTGAQLRRRAFCQDVPCPHNPFQQPDQFYLAGPHVRILSDFEAEFDDTSQNPPRHYQARLVLLEVFRKADKTVAKKVGAGVELDPKSPPSPSSPTHYPASAVKVILSRGSAHAIQIDQLGDMIFLVITT